MFGRHRGGAVRSFTNIYSLVQTLDREERWVIFLFVLTEFYKFTVLHGFELTSFRFEIKKKSKILKRFEPGS